MLHPLPSLPLPISHQLICIFKAPFSFHDYKQNKNILKTAPVFAQCKSLDGVAKFSNSITAVWANQQPQRPLWWPRHLGYA